MAQHKVIVSKEVAAPAAIVWQIIGSFGRHWHPAVAAISVEQDAAGNTIRLFQVHGEDKVYRERLTFFSHSDMRFRYEHVSGIDGVARYAASLSVVAKDMDRCTIEWSAELDAEEPRATAIVEGTRTIFQAGIAALNALLPQRLEVVGNPRLSMLVAGEKSATACLFLHGIGGNSQNWQQQIMAVARHMRAAALDLRGYGGSELGDRQSSIDDYCNDILRAIEVINAERIVLCGLSLGAWIATSFAMRHQKKLAGLVLAGGCTGMSEASEDEQQRFRQSRQVPLDQGKSPKDFADAVVSIIASPQAGEEVKRQLHQSMSTITTAAYGDALNCFTRPEEQFDFGRLTMPVMLVTGEHDKLATPQEIRGVADRIHSAGKCPRVRFELLGGAGHVCNLEQPEGFNRLLLDFLELVPR